MASSTRRRSADVGSSLEATLEEGGAEAPPTAPGSTGGQGKPSVTLPELPTAKTGTAKKLEEQTILLHGPPGIGKSTLASEFPDFLFLDCAGELSGLDVYKMTVTNWDEFRLACASIVQDRKQFKGVVIDTVDALATYCRQASNLKMGIEHESQADWGQGWDKVKTEFSPRMAALSALPNFGVVWVAHSKSVEIKTRRQTYDRWVPDLPGAIGSQLIKNADLILYLEWAEEDERVIYTKPSPYHEAKERGINPHLPEQIEWPMGVNGYQVLKAAWGEEKK